MKKGELLRVAALLGMFASTVAWVAHFVLMASIGWSVMVHANQYGEGWFELVGFAVATIMGLWFVWDYAKMH